MLEQRFETVYTKFKLHFYQEIFERFQNREASLTTVETFAMETIQALGSPTVNEFASFMRISPPNAAYKINSLIRKGYVQKIQSAQDKREYHLQVTQKYKEYYNISNDYVHVVTERMRQRFTRRVRQAGGDALYHQQGTDARDQPGHGGDALNKVKKSPTGTPVGLFLFDIQLRGHVDLVGDILAVLLPLPDTLGEQVLDLAVHRAEVILRPGGNGGIQLGREPQRDLLLAVRRHISTGSRN